MGAPSDPTGDAPRPARPLWQHALALLLLLAALVPVIGTDSAFVTDESFVVIQLDTIEETGEWTLPHPVPEVDPGGAAFSLHGASRYESGYTLYGKHPALIYLYLPVHKAFGIVGLVALSVLGTWAAAVAAGALAQRIVRGSAPIALWLVGVGSPLFFDAFLVHAHTLAAALAALAGLLVVRSINEERPLLGVGALAALLGVALLRSEGVLFAGAFGGAVGLVGLLRRRAWLVLLGAAGCVAGVAAFGLDRIWADVVAGGDPVRTDSFERTTQTFLEGRRTSATFTLVMPGYRGGTAAELLTLLGAALLVLGAIVLRRRPSDEGAVLLPIVGAALLVARSVMEWGPVPGLLVAFCLGVVGLVLMPASVVRSPTARFLLLASAVYAVAVGLTQYPSGGHTEWGGRYFALAIPFVGAVGGASLKRVLGAWPRRTARALGGAMAATALALGVLAVSTLIASHERNRDRSDGVLSAAAELPAQDGQPPIVVTDDDQVPRLARGRYEEARFLLVPRRELTTYLARLARHGVDDVLLVAANPQESLERVPVTWEQIGPVEPHSLQYEEGAGLIRLHHVGP